MGECYLSNYGTTQSSTPQAGSSGDSGGLPLGTLIHTLCNESYLPQGCLPVTGLQYDGTFGDYETFFDEYVKPTVESTASLKRCYFRTETETTYTYNYDIYYDTPVPASQWGENTNLSDSSLVAIYGNDHSLIEVPEFTPNLEEDWTLTLRLKFFTLKPELTVLFGVQISDVETETSFTNRVFISSDHTQIGLATATSNSVYVTLPRAVEVNDIVTFTIKSYAETYNMSLQCTLNNETPTEESFMHLATHMDFREFVIGFVEGLTESYTGSGDIGLLFDSKGMQGGQTIWEARTTNTIVNRIKDYSYSSVVTQIGNPRVLLLDDALWQQERSSSGMVGVIGLATNVTAVCSNTSINVAVANKALLVSEYLTYYGDYWLSFDDVQDSWTINGDTPIDLTDIGLTVSGIPAGGDYITVSYSQGTNFRTPLIPENYSFKTGAGSNLGKKSNGSVPEAGGIPSFIGYRTFMLVSSIGGGTGIGVPIFTFERTLENNEVWLEGAIVKQANYPKLYEIYGSTFNTGSVASDSFQLPDLRGRTIQGVANTSPIGYVEAGLPNHEHYSVTMQPNGVTNGLYTAQVINPRGSRSNWDYSLQFNNVTPTRGETSLISDGIYGKSTTVTVAHLKVYVKTRFK